MSRSTLLGFVGFLLLRSAGTTAIGQPQSAPPPSFEVASIKPANPEILQRRGLACGFAQDRFYGLGDLRWFIACAYGIPAARSTQEIAGLPKWAEELFEIQATFPAHDRGSSVRASEGMVMLQTLLADRFSLAVHRESRVLPGYALVIARKDAGLGPQLQPTPTACVDWIGGGRQGEPPMVFRDLPCGRGEMRANIMRQSRVPLSRLATLLSLHVERPVEDRTGLSGLYAFDLRWAAASPAGPINDGSSPAAMPDNLPASIFTALQEQLGLKLEPIKTTTDLLVIDHVERPRPN